jgi:type I restriction enzyme, S subunit
LFAFPPEDEQVRIVDFLGAATAETDRAIEDARSQICLLNEYRARVIGDVVTGKLDVRAAAASLPEQEIEAALEREDQLDDDGEAEVEEAA